MQESLFKSSLRSFLKGASIVIGIFIASLVVIVVIAAVFNTASESSKVKIEREKKIVILPDAKGERVEQDDSTPVILQLNIEGVIGIGKLKSQEVRDLLIESREGVLKDRIKGILLNINTPGGTVVDGDSIYRAIQEYKNQYHVPVIAYIDGLCASGGMYVACAADEIYASDVSLIGSVGVIMPSVLNFSKFMETIGIDQKTMIAGKGKDELNPLRPWKPDEGESYQHLINYYYDRFVEIVLTNRPKMSKDRLVQVNGAKIFPAPQAEEYGYIDGSGLEKREVIEILLKKTGIGDEEKYQVVALEDTNWIKELFLQQSSDQGNRFSGTIRHQFQWNSDLDPSLEGKFLYLYRN